MPVVSHPSLTSTQHRQAGLTFLILFCIMKQTSPLTGSVLRNVYTAIWWVSWFLNYLFDSYTDENDSVGVSGVEEGSGGVTFHTLTRCIKFKVNLP